jgi:alpha-1,4-digalacturonate transport system substrate-binding protein
VFGNGVSSIALEAFMFQGYKYNRAMMSPTVSRVTQAIVGELSVDDAMARLATDMSDAVKAASK